MAIYFAQSARSITLLVRGDALAKSMSDYLIKELESTARVQVRLQTEVAAARGDHRLTELLPRDRRTGQQETLPAAALRPGMQPRVPQPPFRNQGRLAPGTLPREPAELPHHEGDLAERFPRHSVLIGQHDDDQDDTAGRAVYEEVVVDQLIADLAEEGPALGW